MTDKRALLELAKAVDELWQYNAILAGAADVVHQAELNAEVGTVPANITMSIECLRHVLFAGNGSPGRVRLQRLIDEASK